MRRALTLAIAALGALVSCAKNPGGAYLSAKAAGDRAYSAGRFADAATGYSYAADRAIRPRDREEALYLQAAAYRRERRWNDANEAYRRLLAAFPRGERSARAALDLAEIQIDAGRPERARDLLRDVIMTYPDSGSARHALVLYLAPLDTAQATEWLRTTLPKLETSELDETLRYAYAKRLEAAGSLREARDALIDLSRRHPYPQGSLFDDALWNASLLDERLGRPREAVLDLQQMLSVREVSTLTGSYERARFSPAAHRIAVLYRDALSDHAAARRAFHDVYEHYTTSLLRDDALWEEAKLADSDGDHRAACSLLAKLAAEFPASRFTPCAPKLCTSLPAPQGSASCHAYVVRDE
jgi:TolA-binding protein